MVWGAILSLGSCVLGDITEVFLRNLGGRGKRGRPWCSVLSLSFRDQGYFLGFTPWASFWSSFGCEREPWTLVLRVAYLPLCWNLASLPHFFLAEAVRGSKGSQPCRLLLMVCPAVLTAGILQARKAPGGGHCAPVPRSEDPSGRPTAVQGGEDRHHPEE